MYSMITSQTSLADVITLDEAKRQCRILPDDNLDDDDLTHLISVCTELAQTYTHRLLTQGEVICEVEESVTEIQLPWGNASSVKSVTVDGIDVSDYTFSPVTQKVKFSSSVSNVVVTYLAGYAEVPTKVKHGILMMISTFYNNRDDFISGMTIEEIPTTSRKILDSVRFYLV